LQGIKDTKTRQSEWHKESSIPKQGNQKSNHETVSNHKPWWWCLGEVPQNQPIRPCGCGVKIEPPGPSTHRHPPRRHHRSKHYPTLTKPTHKFLETTPKSARFEARLRRTIRLSTDQSRNGGAQHHVLEILSSETRN
jgi:hypothetical protein